MNSDLASAFMDAWRQGEKQFTIFTSGSTGTPKPIILQRKWMQWSAAQTAHYLKPGIGDKLYCCLPVNRVGGLMMLVRSQEWGIPVEVAEPSSNPLLDDIDASIISLTPMQLFNVSREAASWQRLMGFREVLIGGGELSPSLEAMIKPLRKPVFRHSYGMTETYSHIALRTISGELHSDWFIPFEGVYVERDELGCAVIHLPFYEDGLETNDLIETNEQGWFRVTGRKDFMINSGGVKLQPELIEKSISEHLSPKYGYVVSEVKDEALGNKVALVCEDLSDFKGRDLSFLKTLNPYAVPKVIIAIEQLPLNSSGKVDRLKIRELINK